MPHKNYPKIGLKSPMHAVAIGDKVFNNLHDAYKHAVFAGYNGSEHLFRARYGRGIRNWEEITRKVKPYEKRRLMENSEAAKRGHMKRYNEMADIILELDRRKAELANKS
jgi:hypothetical protein